MAIPTKHIFEEYQNQKKHWHIGGMKMFNMYIFKYNFFKHDMTPLVLPFGYEPQHHTYQAINLHYLHPEVRLAVLETLDFMKLINPDTKEVVFDYEMLKHLFKDTSICLRRYKAEGVSVLRYIPLEDFIDRHWQSPGAMSSTFRTEMHSRSLLSMQVKLKDKGII
jgi:hypothetical protein